MSLLALGLAGVAMLSQDAAALPPALRREFRAAWVATVDNIDWPSKRGLPTDKAIAELKQILDTAKRLNFNAVVLQVRPSADALYPSQLEPWSEYLTGQQGKPPEPYWDPLAYAVQEAHKRGLELHCWFNPYRAWHPAAKGTPARNYVGTTHRHAVRNYGRYQWMDPAETDTQQRTIEVMMDVARRYDIDGVHIDDYFYPYKERDNQGRAIDFPDKGSFERYRAEGGALDRDDWRREQVNQFVERFYRQLKAERPWVKFGISPFGIYRPGVPEGIKAGVDQYADLYADVLKWWHEGWLDYLSPQLYWPIGQTPQSYPKLLEYWRDENKQKRHLWIGNYSGRLDSANGNWNTSELLNQIRLTREKGAGGNVFFSMKTFLRDWKGINLALLRGLYAAPALVPASPWLDEEPPAAPSLLERKPVGASIEATWTTEGEPIRFYLVQVRRAGQWRTEQISGNAMVRLMQVDKIEGVAVTAIDRVGNAGPPLLFDVAGR
jgi:uncharacterized lipoprotein YddW (UPF0748 family)